MDLKEFLSQDLKTFKKKLNEELYFVLNTRNEFQDTIIHYITWYSLKEVKYILPFLKSNSQSLFFKKSNYGYTFIYPLFQHRNSLNKIKYVLNFCKSNFPSLFFSKDIYGITCLNYLIIRKQKLYIIKYVLNFFNLNYPSLFLEKNDFAGSIINYLFDWKVPFRRLKYVLKFFKTHFPTMLLEKAIDDNNPLTITRRKDLIQLKYIYNFYMRNFPFSFLEKNINGTLLQYRFNFENHNLISKEHAYKFCKYNFPEISLSTNNFILPLMMEIQN